MAYAATAWAAQDTVVNLSRGIWVTQIGDIKAQDETMATLYYTLYGGSDGLRVKSVDYHYNGSGQMEFLNKDTICGSASIQGADGIAHHPDGDLLIAAQGKGIYKIKKNTERGKRQTGCMRKTVAASTGGYWHLMMTTIKSTCGLRICPVLRFAILYIRQQTRMVLETRGIPFKSRLKTESIQEITASLCPLLYGMARVMRFSLILITLAADVKRLFLRVLCVAPIMQT